MPRIPNLRQGQRLRPGSPVAIGNTSAARAEGETISEIGRIGGQAVTQLSVLQNKIKADQDRITLNEKDTAIKSAAQESFFEALQQSKADGSDMLTLFDEKFDAKAQERGIFDELDPALQTQVETLFDEHRNSRREQLFPVQIKMAGEHTVNRIQQLVGQSEAAVQIDPLEYSFEKEKLLNLVGKSETLTPQMKARASEIIKQNLARARVDGLAQSGKYEEAKKAVVEEFSSIYTGDARQKKIDEINRRKFVAIDQKLKQEALDRKEKERLVEEEKQANFEQALKLVTEAKNPAEEKVAREFIENKTVLGKIDLRKANFATGALKENIKNRSEILQFEYMAEVQGGEKLDNIRSRVIRSVADGVLLAQDGQDVLRLLNQRKKNISSNPVFKRRYRLADDLIDAHFGKDIFGDLLNPHRRQQKAAAKIEMEDLVGSGIDPVKAAKKTIVNQLGTLEIVPFIPEIETDIQNDEAGLKKAKEQLAKIYSSGLFNKNHQINKKIYLNRLKILNERQNAVKRKAILEEIRNDKGLKEKGVAE